MSKERSKLDKGKQGVRRAGAKVTAAAGTLSGKNVEQQVTEYTELYTPVLLGVHGDLEAQGRKLQDHDSEIEALKRQVASVHTARIISIAALVVAVVAAGGALWAALSMT